MSYYDFDYFWTHQEVGGQKLKLLENKRQLNSIEEMLKFIFSQDNNNVSKDNNNAQNQAENSQEDNDFVDENPS